MARDGFGFFYERLGLSIGNLAFRYNFAETGAFVPVHSGNLSLSGGINNLPNFWDYSGSGYFQDGGISVSGYNSLRDNNWSMFLLSQKLSNNPQTLFSTMDSSKSSGIVVSINSINDVLITTKDSNGYLYSEAFDLPLSDKNLLGFTKAGNVITCHSFDPSSLSLKSSSKSFPFSCNLNNFENLNIGNSLASGLEPFNGYIDEVVLLRTALNARQLEVLSSGFFRDPYSMTLVENSGFAFGSAHCNESGYVSGWNPSSSFTLVETPSVIDFDFMKGFMKSGIKYDSCSGIESLYCVGFKSDPVIKPNANIFFDAVNGYFRSQEALNFSDTLFFYNGLLQNKVSDYLYSSNLFIKSGSNLSAVGVLDSLSHSYSIQEITSGGLTSGSIPMPSNGNSILFLNGSVLISGVDYYVESGDFVIQTDAFSNSSGKLVEIYFDDEIEVFHTSQKFLQTGFYDDYLMCFVNRLRTPLSKFSKLSYIQVGFGQNSLGCFSGDLIYGNEGDYFNVSGFASL